MFAFKIAISQLFYCDKVSNFDLPKDVCDSSH